MIDNEECISAKDIKSGAKLVEVIAMGVVTFAVTVGSIVSAWQIFDEEINTDEEEKK